MNQIKLHWHDIKKNNSNIPTGNGVYAWYYSPRLSSYDIDNFYSNNDSLSEEGIKHFLNKYIFNFFSEEPYEIELSGKLKPKYKGQVEHVDLCSKSLIEKISSKKIGLYDIQELLTEFSECFLSPIYIGMADNLANRIISHKNLIGNYRDSSSFQQNEKEVSIKDSTFASRVVSRGYISNDLFVIVKELNCDEKLENVAENIMNRINYPILGRN